MNSLILFSLLVAGAAANSYGSSRAAPQVRIISYGNPTFSPPPSSYPASSSSMYQQQSSSYSRPPATVVSISPSSGSYHSSPASSSYGYSTPEGNSVTTSYTRNINPAHSDRTSFTTSNGISQSHNVQVVRGRPTTYPGQYGQSVQSDASIVMNGHSYHTSPEGQHISLTWSADENGFAAQGDHLPKPVALPADHAAAHQQAHFMASQSSTGYGGSNTAPVSHSYGSSFNAPAFHSYGTSSNSPVSHGYGATSLASSIGQPPKTQSIRFSSYGGSTQSSYRPTSVATASTYY